MKTNRLEAFSDGVIAIIITIMVLEMKAPHEATPQGLRPLVPVFLSYVLSFVYVGIYWNNHHHVMHAVDRVSGAMLWANLHLLFWLSLIPFATAWMGENHFQTWPVAAYGSVLLLSAVAFKILVAVMLRQEGPGSKLARAMDKDFKTTLSIALYAIGIALAFVAGWAACVLYVAVALMWFIPDRRIEREVAE